MEEIKHQLWFGFGLRLNGWKRVIKMVIIFLWLVHECLRWRVLKPYQTGKRHVFFFNISCLIRTISCFMASKKLKIRSFRDTVSWWFFCTAFIKLLKRSSTAVMKEERCISWIAIAWAILALLRFSVWMCRCRVAMSSVVAVPNKDFNIWPTKWKRSCFDLHDLGEPNDEQIRHGLGS